MPTPRVIASLHPAQLLERAVHGLFPLAPSSPAQPWPTLSAWLVLRQGGLRDDLHRMAAAQGVAGWFDPPVCLFNELAERWGAAGSAVPLAVPERLAIVAGLIDSFGRGTFGAAAGGGDYALISGAGVEPWVPAVDRLIGELVSEGIGPEQLQRALEQTAADDFARRRAAALSRIYIEWLATLRTANRTDGRDGKIRLAAQITANPMAFAAALGARRDVRIVGLADLRGGWKPLLAALSASTALDTLEIHTSFRLELPAELGAEYVEPAGEATFAHAFATRDPFSTPAVRLVEAPDAAREVELIAVRVRALIDAGVAPARIAVVSREERPLVGDMADALATLNVPVSARRRTRLSHTAVARAVFAILDVVRDKWSRHRVVELAEHPLLTTALSASVVNFVGYSRPLESRSAWREAFGALLARAEARHRGDAEAGDRRVVLPPAALVASTAAAWSALDARFVAVESSRPLAEWFAWASALLRDGEWGIAEAINNPLVSHAVRLADTRARDAILDHLDGWQQALTTFGGDRSAVSAAVFAERLRLVLDQDLITPPVTDFGVVVAEALAAGWRAFDYVFVIGLTAGAFPQRPGADRILDQADRSALIAAGLPLDDPDAWRARERALFRVICAAPSTSLTLSWPVMDAEGREVARSAFVDEAAALLSHAAGVPDTDEALEAAGVLERIPTNVALVADFPVAESAFRVALAKIARRCEDERCQTAGVHEVNEWNGIIATPALREWIAARYGEQYSWSATQLEQVAKCRWHWFAERLLKLAPRSDTDDQMEPTVRGTIAHEALNRFYATALDRKQGPVYLLPEDRAWAVPAMQESLQLAWKSAEAQGQWLGPQPLWHVVQTELAADVIGYLQYEMELNASHTNNRTNWSKQIQAGAAEGEVKFADVVLRGGDVTFRLIGTIDRVDRGIDTRVVGASKYIAAIDYKSTKYSTPAGGNKRGWDDGVVLQVPLYAAALQQLRPNDVVARMEYRTLRSPEIVHQLSLAPLKGGAVQDAPEADEKLAGALAAAGRRVAQVRAGELPAEPTASCGCSPYCPARDICRIPGGPVEAGR